jgi:hypothetical protein
MAVKYTKCLYVCKGYPHLELQDLPTFTKIWNFGLKLCIPSGNPASETLLQLYIFVTFFGTKF